MKVIKIQKIKLFIEKCEKEYKYDELLTKDDKFMEEKIKGLKGQLYIAHLDVVKESFWNKEFIDYE